MDRLTTAVNFDDPVFKDVLAHTVQAFRFNEKVNPIHLNDIFDMDLEFRGSHPGIPWMPMYRTHGEIMQCSSARNYIRLLWHRVEKGEPIELPNTQVSYCSHMNEESYTPEVKAVCGSATIILAEAQFAVPLIQGFKHEKTAYCFDMITGGASRLRSDCEEFVPYGYYTGLYFEKFEKSTWMIRMAFKILLQNLDFCRCQGREVSNSEQLHRVWQKLIDYFIVNNMRLCHVCNKKSSNVLSGSYFTHMIDSIINYFFVTYAYLRCIGRPPIYLRVFGTESVSADYEAMNVYCLYEELFNLNLEMILDFNKSSNTPDMDDVEFLNLKNSCCNSNTPDMVNVEFLNLKKSCCNSFSICNFFVQLRKKLFK